MNDNYLWDRSGEPDPEIQKLEELLGELRYQPQPLQIPANITVGRKRSFFVPMTSRGVFTTKDYVASIKSRSQTTRA